MAVDIRFATTETERQAIFRLRYEIYIEEMGFPYEADHQARLLTDGAIQQARLLLAELDGEAVGTLRLQWGGDAPFTTENEEVYDLRRFDPLIRRDQMAIMSRFMTRSTLRDTDIPLRLLQAMFQFYCEQDIQVAFLDCRPHLLNLYLSLGYRTYHRPYNDPIAGLLIPLVLVVSDLAHLEQVKSPFVPILQATSPRSTLSLASLLGHASPVQIVSAKTDPHEWSHIYSNLLSQNPSKVSIFEGFSEDDIERLLQRSPIIECGKGAHIINKDGPDHTVFIILQGSVEVKVDDEVLAVEGAGSVVGEVAFLMHTPRSADVVAATDDVRVLCLRQKALEELIRSESNLAARLLHNLSRVLAVKLVVGNQ